MTNIIFSSILPSQGKVVFDFSVHTKMDRPKFEHVKLKGTFLQSMMGGLSVKSSSGQSIEDFKQIGDQFKAIGKEFKKAFKSN